LVAVVALVVVALLPGVVLGQPASAMPTTRAQNTFEVANPPAQFDVVQDILDFAPRAWTPALIHGGPGFITVIDGEITFRTPDGQTTVKTGEGLADRPGQVHQAGNVGSEPARTFVTLLLPSGGVVTTPQSMANAMTSPTRVVVTLERKFAVAAAPVTFDLVELVQDFPPGAWMPSHTHGGQAFITVLDGQLTTRVNGTEKTFRVGDTWTENPGEFFEVGNATNTTASTMVTFSLPKGAPLTTLRDPVGLPKLGELDLRLAAVVLALLAVGGFVMYRWLSRRPARHEA
jgi:quercetin dioxygenase-like cupin family protein